MVWVPTLRGYPDTGAAALMALAAWIYLRDTRLRHAWQMGAIGFLVTGAVLFRRPFAYSALAFFGAIALLALIKFAQRMRSEPKAAWRELGTNILCIGITASFSLAMVVIFGRSFLIRLLTIDYNALYAAYTRPPLSSFTWYVAAYGWPVFGAAVIGFLLGIRYRILRPDAAKFLVIFGGLTLLAWLLVARQTGEQYTLNFTPTVVLGLAALLWTVMSVVRPTPRRIVLTGGIAYLGVNLLLALSPVTLPNYLNPNPVFAMQEAPLTRSDQAQVLRLVDYFRQIAGDGEPIYVAASSEVMGKDTLVSAEHLSHGWNNSRLNVLYSPEIDSRDFYPLELLLQAQYVLVVDPFQYHLSPGQQRVVQAVYDIFKNNREFARDFVELPEHFPLDGGAAASVYRRVRPTSIPTAIGTLEFMQSFVQTRPGAQPDWMLLDSTAISKIQIDQDRTYRVTTQLAPDGEMTSSKLIYLGTLPGSSELRGEIRFADQGCDGVELRLAALSATGSMESLGEIILHSQDSPDFALPIRKYSQGFLMLSLEGIRPQAPTGTCSINIDHLRVAPA
jgi:hypothetical protein